MRLLYLESDGKINRTNDTNKDIPCYTILSHTWGLDYDEVSFDDLTDPSQLDKSGYWKIKFCGMQAKKDGLQYFWVDTCCINKANHSELSEAITSMFRWYQNASKCYVYMSDVSNLHTTGPNPQPRWETDFRNSRWFTRGWTLQELLAPRTVEFYSKEGHLLGNKRSLENIIHETTGIPVSALRGDPLTNFSIETRLSWAHKRETTRKEDKAYCLQGIFGVFLPLIYGEEDHAFVRLKQAIGEQDKTQDAQIADQDFSRKSRRIESNDSGAQDKPQRLPVEDGPTVKDALTIFRFDQIDDRLANITPWQSKTCEWLFESKAYLDWINPTMLQEHCGFFWIKGKPGCGKSTLAKFMFNNLKAASPKDIFVSFFFNARGAPLEKGILGLYRSLIVQILSQCLKPGDLWARFFPDAQPLTDRFLSNPIRLKNLFHQVVRLLGHKSITIIVDALDEGDESEVREMIEFFEQLGEDAVTSRRTVRILLTSRYYPHITVRKTVGLKVEDQSGHTEDIKMYISKQLRVDKSKTTQAIQEEIQNRAQGVFIWVVMVVHILNQAYDHGQVHSLRKKLQELPNNLHDLFKNVLTRNRENMEQTQLCVQWVLFAQRPLKLEELYFAILSGTEPDALDTWDSELIGEKTMERFILSSSKGLVEVTMTEDRTVQFIHESVRDFLLKEEELSDFMSCSKFELYGLIHGRLQKCCAVYLQSDILDSELEYESLPVASSRQGRASRERIAKAFPFLHYSVRHILTHADISQSMGFDQSSFLEHFPLSRWTRLHNIMAESESQRHPDNINPLYVLAEGNYPHLIQSIVRDMLHRREHGGCHGNPIFAAIASRSEEAFEELLKAEREINPQGCTFPYENDTPLVFLGLHAVSKLVSQCLTFYKFDFSGGNRNINEWLLMAMVTHGHDEALRLLIDKGVDVNTQKGKALRVACEQGHEDIVKTLLTKRVLVNANGALQVACRNGHESIVRTLIAAGADVNLRDDWGMNALQAACLGGHKNVVQMLLAKGMDVNEAGGIYGTAYQAAQSGSNLREQRNGEYVSVIQLLLDAGALPTDYDDPPTNVVEWDRRRDDKRKKPKAHYLDDSIVPI